jgi:hypothetical protein
MWACVCEYVLHWEPTDLCNMRKRAHIVLEIALTRVVDCTFSPKILSSGSETYFLPQIILSATKIWLQVPGYMHRNYR